jgi:hypothetical protein
MPIISISEHRLNYTESVQADTSALIDGMHWCGVTQCRFYNPSSAFCSKAGILVSQCAVW